MSWKTAVVNLEFTQGQTFDKEWAFTQSGSAVDMTGWTGAAQIRDKAGTVLADLTSANGGVVITEAQGRVKIVLSDTATDAVAETTDDLHLWDLELDTGSTIEKPFRGAVIVHKGITVPVA